MKLKLFFIFCVAASSISAQIVPGDALKINSCYGSGKSLSTLNSSLEESAGIVVWTETNVPAQRWLASDAGENLFYLTNAYSEIPLVNSSHRPNAGNRLVQESNQNAYGKWEFIPVGNPSCPNACFIRFSEQPNGNALYVELTDDVDGSQVKLQFKRSDADSLRQMWTVTPENILPNRVTPALRDSVMHGWKDRYFKMLKTSTGFWGEAETMETILDAYETTGKQEYKTMFEEVYEHFVGYPAGWGQSGNGQNWNWNEYNDDIAWAVLASVRAYLLFGQHPNSGIDYLNIAKNNYDLMYSRALLPSGMLRWKQTPGGNQGTNSCINGPAEIAACYLAIATGDNAYYEKAKSLYDLQRRYLYEPATGKVFDAGKWENGSFSIVNNWVSTYNQGTFLGAALMLYNHYGTAQYKNDAHKIVEWTRNDLCDARGVVRVCGSGDDLQGFKGILMRYLRRYVVDLSVPEKIEWLQRNALQAYNNRNSKGVIWTAWWEKTPEDFVFSDGYDFTNAFFGCSTAVSAAFNAPLSAGTETGNYPKNRAPLMEIPFMALPVGSVKAEGWLLKQLHLQKDGLTGHAEELYRSNSDLGPGCDWLGGAGDSWERAPYYVKGLVALAYTLDDEELKAKAQKWIDWSLDNQRRSGYFGPANNNDWWARMPMLYAIRDYYEATGDARVIPFFTKYFQYQNNTIESQPLSSWGKSRAGDNIEIVFWLYNRTGDAFLLELADKLKKQAYDWTNIFTHNLFNQFGTDFQPKHNVNIPQAMKMPAIYYQKSQQQADKSAYFLGREHLLHDHGQPYGMESGCEMIAGKSSMTGLELCSVVEQMQTSETAQMILGDASIGDQLEKVAFNALPGGLTADIKGLQYYQQANQVISKLGYTGFAQNYDNGYVPGPYSGYGCCRFDFHMGYPYFVKTLWAATSDNGLAAMAYGPSQVTARVAGNIEISIHEATDYPFGERLTFTLTAPEAVAFPLKFRIPAWCSAPEIKVNGIVQTGVESGSFYTINRTWNNSDVVAIHFPMPLMVSEEVNSAVSIQRGPLVFSLRIDESRSLKNNYGNGFAENEVLPASAWNYALVIDRDNPSASIRVIEGEMPENPFIQETTPVKLLVPARKLAGWQYAHNGCMAVDPPYSPVATQSDLEQVTLVPYGSETLRVTCLPYAGEPNVPANVFTEDFSGGQSGWVQYGGSWTVKDGFYLAGQVEAGHPCSKSVYTAVHFSDFVYEADVQINSDRGDAGLMFRAGRMAFAPDDYDGYYVGISSADSKVVLGKANGAWNQLIAVPVNINTNQWYHIKIEATGANMKVYVDNMNVPKITFSDASFAAGSIGVRSWNALARWDNISVTALFGSAICVPETDGGVFLYPNPVTNRLSINIPQSGRMVIYDSAGKQVFSADVPPGIATLDTGGYSEGVYFVRLTSGNTGACVRFIKGHG